MTKRLITLSLMIFMSLSLMAQLMDAPKNVIKLGLTPLIFTNFALSYERAIVGPLSGILNVSIKPSSPLPGIITDAMAGDVDDVNYKSPFTEMSWSGWSIMPEVRVYPFPTKPAPKGFYLGLYYRIAQWKLESTYEATHSVTNAKYDIDFEATFKPSGGGLIIGKQWLIGNRVAIDWWMLGLGWGSEKTQVDLTSADAGIDALELENQGLKFKADVQYIDLEIESIENGGRLTAKSAWPNLRSGFAIGFAF